jgi:anti-sigma B factor antagonist
MLRNELPNQKLTTINPERFNMQLKDELRGDIGIISLKGKLMGTPETENLHNEIRSLINQGAKKVVLDMGGVTWLNSTGVGSIMRSYTSVMNNGGVLSLANLSEKVQNLFFVTQLIRIFKVYDSVEEAVKTYETE